MLETINHKVQFCVIGGGLAGMCAAIAAARHGVRTLIMHERPVFGGNASSEVRMSISGATKMWPQHRETGIVEELDLENMYRNPDSCYSIWDSVLFEKVRFQENLVSLLNCSCLDAEVCEGRIRSVKGWQQTTQTFHTVEADYFADCSGDSILAPLVGAEFRIGREDKREFGESLAQDKADRKTMGMSCLIQMRETDSPKTFTPPAWANRYPDDDVLPDRPHQIARLCNYWWLELGGDRDSIRDTEEVRDELLKAAFGVWDHIKNRGDHHAENWALDWVGFLPGKRESRRYMGDYIFTQGDVQSGGHFDDTVAYGGWPLDDHDPGGLNQPGHPNEFVYPKEPYGIPARCLYSRNIENLLFAGRNISTSHTGLSSTRVMATCATLGEAAGVIVHYAVRDGLTPRETCKRHIEAIRQTLMDDDCWLPGFTRAISPLCREARLTADCGDPEALRNGIDRTLDGVSNAWECGAGNFAEYDFGRPADLRRVRLVFDSDFTRTAKNVLFNYPLHEPPRVTPATLIKGFHLEADGREVFRCTNNYQRLVRIPLALKATRLRLVIDTPRTPLSKVFAFEAE